MTTKRIAGVVLRRPTDPGRQDRRSGRILLSPETGDVFRAVASYLGCTLDELAQRMLADYIPRHVPQLEIVFDDDDIAQRDLAAVRGAVSIFGTPAVGAEVSGRPKRGKRR